MLRHSLKYKRRMMPMKGKRRRKQGFAGKVSDQDAYPTSVKAKRRSSFGQQEQTIMQL